MTEGHHAPCEKEDGLKNNASTSTKSKPFISGALLKNNQLLGPFSDPIQWLLIKYKDSINIENGLIYCKSSELELFRSVDIAKHPKEQNVDIVFQNGSFYFRLNQDIDSSLCKLLAWFSEELSSKLPCPMMATLNGSKRYYCSFCNQVFIYPNPVVIHVLLECSKRQEIFLNHKKTIFSLVKSDRSNSLATKKRGFDIDSLVNDDDKVQNESTKKAKSETEIKSAFRTPLLPSHSLQLDSVSSALLTSMASNISSSVSNQSPYSISTVPSAFRRVNKVTESGGDVIVNNSNQLDLSSLNTLYSINSINYSYGPPLLFPTQSNFVSNFSNSLISSTSSSVSTGLTSSSTSSSSSGSPNSSKQAISPSLLPFLPPSLAALSFPQTNWCAKCNSTFRMTSDLVYHMRSHHKKELFTNPMKKKREEKLRCNICGETFRERHHLTRHMTSH